MEVIWKLLVCEIRRVGVRDPALHLFCIKLFEVNDNHHVVGKDMCVVVYRYSIQHIETDTCVCTFDTFDTCVNVYGVIHRGKRFNITSTPDPPDIRRPWYRCAASQGFARPQ
jgi:hypothetical protein